jgi:NAD(P)-dependent dehydrogenase (short-subunit alcohol dehydrogenase family)
LGLVRTLALEFASHKIRVNMVAPGGIENRMLDSLVAQLGTGRENLVGQIPMRRMATNEEVAKLALFFACDDSSYCTGTCLVADGGYQAG